MSNKPVLGVIRIVAGSATFDFDYHDEEAFDRQVRTLLSSGYFCSPKVFIPLQGITCMLKLPYEIVENMEAQREARGETRQ